MTKDNVVEVVHTDYQIFKFYDMDVPVYELNDDFSDSRNVVVEMSNTLIYLGNREVDVNCVIDAWEQHIDKLSDEEKQEVIAENKPKLD